MIVISLLVTAVHNSIDLGLIIREARLVTVIFIFVELLKLALDLFLIKLQIVSDFD